MTEKRLVTLEECEKMRKSCTELNMEKRGRITDEVSALRREVYILLGTSTATIIIGALNLIINLH